MVDVVSRIDIEHDALLTDAAGMPVTNPQKQGVFADSGSYAASHPLNPNLSTTLSGALSSYADVSQNKTSFLDADLKSVPSVFKAPIDAVKATGESLKTLVVNSYEANLERVKAARKRLQKQEQTVMQKFWAFICSPFQSDKYEEIDVLLAQLLEEMGDKSKDEKQDLIQDFYTDSRLLIDLPEAESQFKKYSIFRMLSSNGVHKITENFSKSRNFTRKLALSILNGIEEKEFVVKASVDDIIDAQNNLKNLIFEYLPEGMTEDQVQEVFEALGKYANMQTEDILAALQNGSFKEKFVAEVRKKAQMIIEENNKRIKEYIREFFETSKGKTVKRLVNRAYEKTQYAKEEYIEKKENTKIAMQKAQEAKEQSEKAIAEAKEEEIKSKNLAERLGYKNMDKDNLYEFLKHESPLQATNLLYSQAKEKKAYWAAYDANVAKEHAEFLETVALNRFEYENMKMEAMFAKMQALMYTQFV